MLKTKRAFVRNKTAVAVGLIMTGCHLLLSTANAQIVTDGSMGTATTLEGPNYRIQQSLGTLSGNNLFHSFAQFNILTGESATFTGDNSIANIISRVTGGDASQILGRLKSDVGNADFYLINPAGVIFGDGARVDVPAAFHVSTASQLIFANGDILNSDTATPSTLSVSAPESFGFLAAQSGNIVFNDSNLKIEASGEVSLVAPNISMNDSAIRMDHGNLTLAAVGAGASQQSISTPGLTGAGSLTLNDADLKIEGDGAGTITMVAQELNISSSEVISSNIDDTDSEVGIAILAGDVTFDKSQIKTETSSGGKAGDIQINADNLYLTGAKGRNSVTIVSSESKAFDDQPSVNDGDGSGPPGDGPPGGGPPGGRSDNRVTEYVADLRANKQDDNLGASGDIIFNISNEMVLTEDTSINSVTQADAAGGSIQINARRLEIDTDQSPGRADITTLTTGTGQAGNLDINVSDEIVLRGNGQINAMTLGDGDAGDININAGSLSISETERTPNPVGRLGIQSISGQESDVDNAPTGSSGDINIALTGDLIMSKGGEIVSITVGDGDAGNINITAENVLVESNPAQGSNIIGSNSLGPDARGDAGNITINARDRVELLGNAFVTTLSNGGGNAGDMTINARSLYMVGNQKEDSRTGINSSTIGPRSEGNAGNVVINVTEDIRLVDGANITSDTENNGNAGNITIRAASMLMSAENDSADTGISSSATAEVPVSGNAANIDIRVTGALQLIGEAELKTESESRGNAGNIHIEAGSFLMDGAEMESAVEGDRFRAGEAGDITIIVENDFTILDGGAIASNTFSGGDAGDIYIEAGNLSLSEFSSITSTAGFNPAAISELLPDAPPDSMEEAQDMVSALETSLSNAGNIQIAVANDMTLNSGSFVDSDSIAAGLAGTIDISATNLTVRGDGLPSRISSTTILGVADAGEINIDVSGRLSLLSGGQISSSTFLSEGNAGFININAGEIVIDSENQFSLDGYIAFAEEEFESLPDNFEELPPNDDDLLELAGVIGILSAPTLITGIISLSDFDATGDAGLINIQANDISILNGGEINTGSRTQGNAGDIVINTNNLTMMQNFADSPRTAIESQVRDGGQGSAGNIIITATGTVSLNDATIAVDSAATVNQDEDIPEPGTIVIEADHLQLTNNASISSSSTGNVEAGRVLIEAYDSIRMEDAQITTSSQNANAGFIGISTTEFFMTNALITTSANISGNGGDIDILSDFILMDTGFIQGNTGGADFSGGDVVIDSDFLIVSNQSLRTGGDTREQFIPNSGINVIQAAAPDGVSGDVNIGGLEFDISDELVAIGGEVLSLEGLQNNPCNASSGSSLANSGKGGLVLQPDGINSPVLTLQELQNRLPANVSQYKHPESELAEGLAYVQCQQNQIHQNMTQEGT